MKKRTFLLFALSILFLLSLNAQFFEKIDEEFEFNGTDLSLKGHDHTVGCTLLEEQEAYKVYAPKKTVIKTKHFTLSDILYFTNLRKEIWYIQAINTGDVVEKAHLKLDLGKGAKYGDVTTDESARFLSYKHMRTTDVYAQWENSDTAYIGITMDWFLSKAIDYRATHDFLPLFGKTVKDEKVKEFLSAYQVPDKRSQFEDLKWLYYYQFGLELYLRDDTLMQAIVYNPDKNNEKFKGYLPFNLTMDDTRKDIKEKLGDPPSTSPKGNIWYYRRPNLQLHVTFNNGGDPTEDDQIAKIVFAVKSE